MALNGKIAVRDSGNPDRFAYLEIVPTTFSGKPSKRLMVVFKTIGCSHARTCGGCSHCELGANAFPGITKENLVKQMDSVLRELEKSGVDLKEIGMVDLLTNGSFLDSEEVPEEARTELVRKASEAFAGASKFVIDTRPEYVTHDAVRPIVRQLEEHGKKLEVSIGYDTTGEMNRKILNKRYGPDELEKAFRVLTDAGAHRMGYVLVKIPGENDFEAIDSAVRTATEILRIGNKMDPEHPNATTVSFEPVFAGKDSAQSKLHELGRWTPAHLFTAAEIVKRVKEQEEFRGNDLIVGLSSEGIAGSWEREAHNRTEKGPDFESTRKAFEALTLFNATQKLKHVNGLLNEQSPANEFWRKTIEMESRIPAKERLGEKQRTYEVVRGFLQARRWQRAV